MTAMKIEAAGEPVRPAAIVNAKIPQAAPMAHAANVRITLLGEAMTVAFGGM